MKPLTRQLGVVVAAAGVLSVVALLHSRSAVSEQPPTTDAAIAGHKHTAGNLKPRDRRTQRYGGQSQPEKATSTMPGQDAFGAIQEIVRLLEADPTTDWSKVDLEALRQHLIDMNEVTLRADVLATPIAGGLDVAVTGEGRALAAIQRMVPRGEFAHAH